MDCNNGGGIAAVEAVAAARKISTPIDPAQIQAAVNAAVPPVVSAQLPTAVNNALAPLVPQIVSDAVTAAVPAATSAAVTAAQAALQPQITNLWTQVANLQTQVTTLTTALNNAKKGIFPYKDKKPKNGVETVILQVDFAGTVTGFEEQHTGAGVFTPIPPVNGTFNAGDNIAIQISGANTTTKDLICSIYFTRA